MAKQQPIHEIRLGAIKAAVWQNTTSNGGTRFNVTLSRLYKDGDKWQRTDSFGRDDLLLVGKVCDLAHSWIFESRSPAAKPQPERTARHSSNQDE